MSVQTNCMAINITIGMWMGHRLDKAKTREVTQGAHADDDAARVNKHLVPKESLKGVVSKFSAVRTHFYKNTLPWKDSGDRLITRKRFQPFMNEHAALRDEAMVEVEEFLTRKYLTARDQAEFRMGTMFNPNDYPSPDALRHKFYVRFDIDGISTAYDFRLEEDNAMQSRITKAVGGLYEKLMKPLTHFAEAMGTPDKIFRDTTVSNLRDIVEMLPELNFTDDPELKALGERIAKSLTPYEAKDLRTNAITRKAVASEASEILESMTGFMHAFGPREEELEDA
jgi:hypothetical protein